ncbi:MAG: ubiquinone/menaquinone biosynthesis C-methylase UbiE [Chlamydiales bacterium]
MEKSKLCSILPAFIVDYTKLNYEEMMAELNFADKQAAVKRDYDKRAREKTDEVIKVAKQYGKEFFDGDRLYGYGGYHYDGRWVQVVERMKEHYGLSEDAAILDIGCAKGFLLHDFKQCMPKSTVRGIDVSRYAIDCSMETVKPHLEVCSAEKLPYADNSFDLVLSLTTIHNLHLEPLKDALKEIQRVSRGKSYITVDAWRNDQEKENLRKWVLTAETALHVDDWEKLFGVVGYTGDYGWFIAE